MAHTTSLSVDASFVRTYSDGVDFAFDLQGALVALESVDHLL